MSTVPPPPARPGESRTQSVRIDFGVLYESRLTNAIGAGQEENFGEVRLDADERWAITHIEFIPPLNVDGTPQPYGDIYLWVDGSAYGGGATFRPIVDGQNLMLPPLTRLYTVAKPSIMLDFTASFQPLGLPPTFLGGLDNQNPLRDTSIKVARRFAVTGRAFGTVNQPRTIRVWGYKFKDRTTVERIYGTTVNYQLNFYDPTTNRRLTLSKTVTDPFNNWSKLAGGNEQSEPSFEVLYRWAQPKNDTRPNTPYPLKHPDNVDNLWNNMYFDLVEHPEEVIIITHLGTRPHPNQRYLLVVVNEQERPMGGWLTTPSAPALNPLHFGVAQPELNLPLYFPLKTLETPILIMNEIGYVAIKDNGTPIPAPADSLTPPIVAMRAYRIVLPTRG